MSDTHTMMVFHRTFNAIFKTWNDVMEHLLTFKMSKRDKFYLFVICLRYKYNRPRNPHTHTHTDLHRLYVSCAIEWKYRSISFTFASRWNKPQTIGWGLKKYPILHNKPFHLRSTTWFFRHIFFKSSFFPVSFMENRTRFQHNHFHVREACTKISWYTTSNHFNYELNYLFICSRKKWNFIDSLPPPIQVSIILIVKLFEFNSILFLIQIRISSIFIWGTFQIKEHSNLNNTICTDCKVNVTGGKRP